MQRKNQTHIYIKTSVLVTTFLEEGVLAENVQNLQILLIQ